MGGGIEMADNLKGSPANHQTQTISLSRCHQANTEFNAMLNSFTQQIGEWVVEVPIGRVASGISDNAKGAVKVRKLP